MSAIRHDHAGEHGIYGLGGHNDGAAHHEPAIVSALALGSPLALREFSSGTTWENWEQPASDGLAARLRPRLDAVAKRGFDVLFATFLLLLGLPLWMLITLAIVLTSPGPVLFRQARCGRGGGLFTCFKFRTMVVDAERRLREDATLASEHAEQWKLRNDPRITTIGRWLRKTSLDELPQPLNVLRGEMSLVGPRPVQPKELTDLYGTVAETVTSVRPGLTGLWQVSGRSTLSYDDRIALDLAYIERRGFWYDLWLILKTVPAVLWGKGGGVTTGTPNQTDATQLTGRRILIVGLNYWPEETGNAPYTTGLAEHLAGRGAGVTVIAGMPYYPQWRVAEGYRGRWRLREQRHDVEIDRFRQYVPGSQSALRRAFFEATFLAHAATARGLDRPDLVLGILPSLGDGVLAAGLARRYGVPYGLLIQDLVGRSAAQSGIAGGDRVARATAAIEGRAARGAARIAVVSDGFRSYLHEAGVDPARVELVPNWSHVSPPTRKRTDVRAELGWADSDHVVLHACNMGLKQGLENVVATARLAAERTPPHRFILMGDGNQRRQLQELAADLPNLDFLAPQPGDRFMDVLAAADVLLVNERGTVVDMSLPSKLTSYFVAGCPVVAAVSPGGATAREVVCSGAGLTVPGDDPAGLVAALDRLAADPVLRAQMGAAGAAYAAMHLMPERSLARAESFLAHIIAAAADRVVLTSDRLDRPVGSFGAERI